MPRPISLKSTLLGAGALTVFGLTAGALPANAADRSVKKTPKVERSMSGISAPQRIQYTSNRDQRSRGDRSRGDRTRGDRTRGDRQTRNRDERRDTRTQDRRRDARAAERRRDLNRHRNLRNNRARVNFANNRYRSNLGISFVFGNYGQNRFRWASSPYGFYNAGFGSYNYYTRNTYCQRILIDGLHRGRIKTISVKQCSNPWHGTYIVQGSERIVSDFYRYY